MSPKQGWRHSLICDGRGAGKDGNQLLQILGHSCIMSPRPSVDHFDFVAQGSAIRQIIHDSALATRVSADVTGTYGQSVR